jgi:urease accessory protein
MPGLKRVTEILRAGAWAPETAADSLCLNYDQRYRRRLRYEATGGTILLLDLPRATVLQPGDGLKLDDGKVVLVHAAPEALMEVTASDAAALIRLAWHIGNRHLAAQLEPDRIVIREDHVIGSMLLGLGASVRSFEGTFSPEAGAYAEHAGHATPFSHLALLQPSGHSHD